MAQHNTETPAAKSRQWHEINEFIQTENSFTTTCRNLPEILGSIITKIEQNDPQIIETLKSAGTNLTAQELREMSSAFELLGSDFQLPALTADTPEAIAKFWQDYHQQLGSKDSNGLQQRFIACLRAMVFYEEHAATIAALSKISGIKDERKFGRISLQADLITPMQRLTRIKLFFSGFLKYVQEKMPEDSPVRQAVESVDRKLIRFLGLANSNIIPGLGANIQEKDGWAVLRQTFQGVVNLLQSEGAVEASKVFTAEKIKDYAFLAVQGMNALVKTTVLPASSSSSSTSSATPPDRPEFDLFNEDPLQSSSHQATNDLVNSCIGLLGHAYGNDADKFSFLIQETEYWLDHYVQQARDIATSEGDAAFIQFKHSVDTVIQALYQINGVIREADPALAANINELCESVRALLTTLKDGLENDTDFFKEALVQEDYGTGVQADQHSPSNSPIKPSSSSSSEPTSSFPLFRPHAGRYTASLESIKRSNQPAMSNEDEEKLAVVDGIASADLINAVDNIAFIWQEDYRGKQNISGNTPLQQFSAFYVGLKASLDSYAGDDQSDVATRAFVRVCRELNTAIDQIVANLAALEEEQQKMAVDAMQMLLQGLQTWIEKKFETINSGNLSKNITVYRQKRQELETSGCRVLGTALVGKVTAVANAWIPCNKQRQAQARTSGINQRLDFTNADDGAGGLASPVISDIGFYHRTDVTTPTSPSKLKEGTNPALHNGIPPDLDLDNGNALPTVYDSNNPISVSANEQLQNDTTGTTGGDTGVTGGSHGGSPAIQASSPAGVDTNHSPAGKNTDPVPGNVPVAVAPNDPVDLDDRVDDLDNDPPPAAVTNPPSSSLQDGSEVVRVQEGANPNVTPTDPANGGVASGTMGVVVPPNANSGTQPPAVQPPAVQPPAVVPPAPPGQNPLDHQGRPDQQQGQVEDPNVANPVVNPIEETQQAWIDRLRAQVTTVFNISAPHLPTQDDELSNADDEETDVTAASYKGTPRELHTQLLNFHLISQAKNAPISKLMQTELGTLINALETFKNSNRDAHAIQAMNDALVHYHAQIQQPTWPLALKSTALTIGLVVTAIVLGIIVGAILGICIDGIAQAIDKGPALFTVVDFGNLFATAVDGVVNLCSGASVLTDVAVNSTLGYGLIGAAVGGGASGLSNLSNDIYVLSSSDYGYQACNFYGLFADQHYHAHRLADTVAEVGEAIKAESIVAQ